MEINYIRILHAFAFVLVIFVFMKIIETDRGRNILSNPEFIFKEKFAVMLLIYSIIFLDFFRLVFGLFCIAFCMAVIISGFNRSRKTRMRI